MIEHYRKAIFKSVAFEVVATTGLDLITNGEFAGIGEGWKLANCSVSGGKLVASAHPFTAITATQSVTPVEGREYNVGYTLGSVTAGGIKPLIGTTEGVVKSTDGIHTQKMVGEARPVNFVLTGGTSFSGTIDDVMCEELPTVFHLPYGTMMCEIRPQGLVTVKIDDSDIAIDLTASVWNPMIHFEADGSTSHYLTFSSLTGSDCECHVHCLVDTELNPDEDEST